MNSREIRKTFLDFFQKHNHALIPSASLVPGDVSGETDETLFIAAGMQPLIPALLSGQHQSGPRLVGIQKCLRTVDIDEVGDNTHNTFFEMMGNWSVGDYFKEEAITLAFKLLTDKEEGFALDPKRLYATVFVGDDNVSKDMDSYGFWADIFSDLQEKTGDDSFSPEKRIFFLGKDNWWQAGQTSPCGPSSEIFYDMTSSHTSGMNTEEFLKLSDQDDQLVELWNLVFMAYDKKAGVVVGELASQNIDTGSGFERIASALQGVRSVYETDILKPMMDFLLESSGKNDAKSNKSARIICDHMRACIFMIGDGIQHQNKGRGYILRRLQRRAISHLYSLGLKDLDTKKIQSFIFDYYKDVYQNLAESRNEIEDALEKENLAFSKTLIKGMKEFEKGERDAFVLFATYGFPLEMTQELAKEKGETIDADLFESNLKEHKLSSRSASSGMFKGGLADDQVETIKLHTAHHLLLAALQKHVSQNITQRGSNITSERMRMDFEHDEKLTDQQKNAVQQQVNDWIKEGLPVIHRTLPKQEAENLGAQMEFGAKYPDEVSVYSVGEVGAPISIEFCGGPHIENTSELGEFKIKKESSSSKGVRRIKAILT